MGSGRVEFVGCDPGVASTRTGKLVTCCNGPIPEKCMLGWDCEQSRPQLMQVRSVPMAQAIPLP
jgi:hypothetical protein